MDKFERWEKMLSSVGTCPRIWKVFEEMKQEIIYLQDENNNLEKQYEGALLVSNYKVKPKNFIEF